MSIEKKTAVAILDEALVKGDFTSYTSTQRLDHLKKVCVALGLNPLTQPFEFLVLKSKNKKTEQWETKTILYAKKDATDQLRKLHTVVICNVEDKIIGDMFRVAVHAKTPDGRTDCDIGVVSIKGLSGDDLANAMMKAFTKAKRRVTLSICGLGILDESELETIPDAQPLKDVTPKPELIGAKVESPKNATSINPSNYPPHPDDQITMIPIKYNDLMKWKTELGNAATMDSLQQVFGVVTMELKEKYPGNKEAIKLICSIKDECKAKIQELNAM